jgi:hypothetical protein
VTATSVGVVLLGTRVLAGRRAKPAPTPETAEEAPPAPPRLPVFRPVPTPAPIPARSTGLCHLRGKVVVPAGTETPELDDLSVTADDGEHEYEAKTNDRGEFELHLPARVYTLVASVDDLVGTAIVRARPGPDEATVVLQPGAAIEGTVNLPTGIVATIEVAATRAGTPISAGEKVESENGHFALGGLVKGGVYDVTITGHGVRTTVLRGIAAPGTVQVELPAPAVLRGAIGFAAGTDCPIETVTLETANGAREAEIDRNCQFLFDELEPGSEVELRASGGGWHLETRLRLPEHGDPEPVCLNPPCQEPPPDVPVMLRVILTGAPEPGFNVSVSQGDDERSCGTSGAYCPIEGLAVGPSRVTVTASDCARMQRDVPLAAGVNVAAFTCQRLRLVEGVARRSDPHLTAVVSCRDGGNVLLDGKSVFQLRCPRDATEIRYRTAHQPWRTTPLPPNVDPAFVELTL